MFDIRDFTDDDPFTLIRQGYNVINRCVCCPIVLIKSQPYHWTSVSDDAFQYIVMKQVRKLVVPLCKTLSHIDALLSLDHFLGC